jgi:CRP-like cAMP-binding protein
MQAQIQDKLERFFAQFQHQHYKKGEILIRADEEPSGVFYLITGHVKEYAISTKGEEVVVNIFKPLSFFPMSWAINGTPNKYFFEAITDIEVKKTPKQQVVEFLREESDVVFDLLSRVYSGTDGLLLRLVYLMSGSANNRLATEIIILAKRLGKKNGEQVEINISEKELAALSGMTRETVSRELKILRDHHLVQFDKGILTITNLTKLQEELS